MRSATTSAMPHIAATADNAVRSLAARAAGLAIACLIPALFWSAAAALVSHWLGSPLSLSAIELIGGAIALFLAVVCAPIMLRGEPEQGSEPVPQYAFARGRGGRAADAFPLSPEIHAQAFRRDL